MSKRCCSCKIRQFKRTQVVTTARFTTRVFATFSDCIESKFWFCFIYLLKTANGGGPRLEEVIGNANINKQGRTCTHKHNSSNKKHGRKWRNWRGARGRAARTGKLNVKTGPPFSWHFDISYSSICCIFAFFWVFSRFYAVWTSTTSRVSPTFLNLFLNFS